MAKTIGVVAGTPARRNQNIDMMADKFGGQCGQPIQTALRKARFDYYVTALDEARFAQPFPERGDDMRRVARRARAEIPDQGRRLLRARHNRPRHCATSKRYELSSPHG
jgi:hypothetical protein